MHKKVSCECRNLKPEGPSIRKMDAYYVTRTAESRDIPGMCVLLSELFSIENDFNPDAEKQARGLSYLIRDRKDTSIVIVAETGGDIIGMCSVQTLISTSEGGTVGLLEDLIVKKEFRGRGVGTELLCAIFQWCERRKISRVQLLRDIDNKDAHDFYLSQGWDDTKLVSMRAFI